MNRRVLPLVVWVVALVVGTASFHAMGDGPLAAPPLDPSSWGAWLEGREPLVAVVAILRLVVLALSWYLVGATTIGILARVLRAARLVRLADALTVPALRRLLQGALGMSLATAMVTSAPPVDVTPSGAGADRSGGEDRTASVAADPDDVEVALTSLRPVGPTGDEDGGVTLTAVDEDGEPDGVDDPGGGPDAAPERDPPSGADDEVTLEHAGRDRPLPMEVLDDREARRLERDGDATVDEPAEGADELAATDAPSEASGTPEPGAASDEGPPDGPHDGARGVEDTSAADGAAGEADEPAGAAAPSHTVVAGNSLWTIARDTLASATGSEPSDATVAVYWERLIAANDDRLADPDNPDLIFPGQEFVLPDVGVPAR